MGVQNSQKGFTLVELSIVLVIIGLIISSVLVGQDLIRSAEVRSTVTQFESFNAAIGTFRARYSGLPGDTAGNTEFNFTGDGNGDGVLTDASFTNFSNVDVRDTHNGELVFFWSHLGSTGAEFINGSYAGAAITDAATLNANAPQTRTGGSWGVMSVDGINYFIIGATGAAGYATANVLSPLDARDIDNKIDDANPIRGIVVAKGANASEPNTDPSYDDSDAGTPPEGPGCVSGTAADYGAAVTANSAGYNTNGDSSNACTLRLKISI